MHNVLKCNDCAVSKCKYWISKKHRDGDYENIPLIKDSRECKLFRARDTFNQPLLLHLFRDNTKIGNLIKLLKMHNISIKDKYNYPYFKLKLKKVE